MIGVRKLGERRRTRERIVDTGVVVAAAPFEYSDRTSIPGFEPDEELERDLAAIDVYHRRAIASSHDAYVG